MQRIPISPSNSSTSSGDETLDLGGVSSGVIEELGVTGMGEITETFTKDINSNFSLTIRGAIGEGWIVHEPLEVEVRETDDGELLVRDHEFEFYGKGATLDKAIEDYRVALKDHYMMYKEYLEENDHEPTRKLFRYLRSYIKKTPEMA